MDIVRPRRRFALRSELIVPAALVGVCALALRFGFPALLHPPAALPAIERANVVVDVARVEPIVRAVRASGTLVSNRIVVVATDADGIVERVDVKPGSFVARGAAVAELHNPDLDAAVADARAQVDVARAEVASAAEEARGARLDAESSLRSALGTMQRSHEEAVADTTMLQRGWIATLPAHQAQSKADEDRALYTIAEHKIDVDAAAERAKVAIAQAALDRATATLAACLDKAGELTVRASSAGVVQSVSAEAGERIAAGGEIARLADERDLKATLQVAEGDLPGVAVGKPVTLESNGSARITGRVASIAPSAVNGSVAVDVALGDGASQLRPSQDVDGTIELYRSHRALTIARPEGIADGSDASLYRMTPDGSRAARVRVRFGAGSLDRIEVRTGLAPGDTVIVSDMSAVAAAPIVRIDHP